MNLHKQSNQKLDPGLKLIVFLLSVIFIAVLPLQYYLPHITSALILLPVLIYLSRAGKLKLSNLFKLLPMIILFTLPLPFSNENGKVIFKTEYFNIYKEGLYLFSILNLKFIIILMLSFTLNAVTGISEITSGMKRMKFPDLLISIIYLSHQFIYILYGEFTRTLRAFKSRYIDLSISDKLKYFTHLLAAYFARMFSRNEKVYNALVSRGFDGRIPPFYNPVWKVKDTVVLILFILLLTGTGLTSLLQ